MLTYRLAVKADIDNIVKLVESAYRGDSSRQGWTTEADFIAGQRTDRQEIMEILAKPDHVILLCEYRSRLMASVQLNRDSAKAYLGMFAVEPPKQGQGIGLSLLKQAESYVLKEWGSVALNMRVISTREELINWYCRHGYEKTGKSTPFPYAEPRYGIPNRDDLELETLEKKL
ncbi:MAG: GNAT family N-acetyltransferase [Gammaproteobacteria bacterium]|nr:GNAT family N-acetyltransferase [Gammaproteobacteria bacterium]